MPNKYRIALAVLACAVAAGCRLDSAPPASAGPIPPTVVIQSHASGLCVAAIGTDGAAPAVGTRCDAAPNGQRRVRIHIGSSHEQNLESVSTYPYVPMCLDVTDGVKPDGTELRVWRCTDPTYPLYVHTKVDIRCLDESIVDGLRIRIWTCATRPVNPAQLWAGPRYVPAATR